MCRFRSAEAIKTSESTVELKFVAGNDSHEVIKEEHHICDGVGAAARLHTPLEAIPGPGGLMDLNGYQLVFDAGRPDWWTDEMTESALRQFRDEIGRLLAGGPTLQWGGNLDLGRVTSLPASAKLSAGGNLYLGSVTSLPASAKLSAGGNLYLAGKTIQGPYQQNWPKMEGKN
jgi:hypothetical protein